MQVSDLLYGGPSVWTLTLQCLEKGPLEPEQPQRMGQRLEKAGSRGKMVDTTLCTRESSSMRVCFTAKYSDVTDATVERGRVFHDGSGHST